MRYEFQNQYGIFDFTPEDEVYARLTEIIISKRFKELPSIFEICKCTIYDITNENISFEPRFFNIGKIGNHFIFIFSSEQSAVDGLQLHYEKMKEIDSKEFMEVYNGILHEDNCNEEEDNNAIKLSKSHPKPQKQLSSDFVYYKLPSLNALFYISLPEASALYECNGSYLLYAQSCMLLDDFFDRFYGSGVKCLISKNISKMTKGE